MSYLEYASPFVPSGRLHAYQLDILRRPRVGAPALRFDPPDLVMEPFDPRFSVLEMNPEIDDAILRLRHQRGVFDSFDFVGQLRDRYPLLEASPEVDAAIRELWPEAQYFESVEDYFAWFSTAVAAGLDRTCWPPIKRKPRARARRVGRHAHARKPRCELGGFFSSDKVNLRNTP